MKRVFFLVIMLVAVLMASFGPANAAVITVTSYPLWTDSGFVLDGSQVTISGASGSWTWGGGVYTGPDGTVLDPSTQPWAYDEFITNGHHGQLIGFIGVDPFTALQNSASFFVISTGTVNLSGEFGKLWLGFNDDMFSHNTGDNSGTVTVNVNPVPEPGTMMLLGSGLVGLAGYGRRRMKK